MTLAVAALLLVGSAAAAPTRLLVVDGQSSSLTDPQWFANGSLAFIDHSSATYSGRPIVSVNSDGAYSQPLTDATANVFGYAANATMAVWYEDGWGAGELYARAAGGHRVLLATGVFPNGGLSLAPGGKTVAWFDQNSSTHDIMVIATDGSQAAPVDLTSGLQVNTWWHWPSWNPAGTKIVFSSGTLGDLDTVDLSGTVTTLVAGSYDGSTGYTTTAAYGPSWGPNGKIVYWNYTGSNNSNTVDQLRLVNGDGSDSQLVASWAESTDTSNIRDYAQPVWSRDGTQVAFAPQGAWWVGGDSDLFVVDLASGAVTNLLATSTGDNVQGCEDQPNAIAFSPTGDEIVYPNYTTGGCGIYIAPIGSGPPPHATPSASQQQTYGPVDGGIDLINPSGSFDEVNTATGGYSTQVTDAKLPGIGIPFVFTRTYNSGNQTAGRFGPGWTDPYSTSLKFPSGGRVLLTSENGQSQIFTPDGSGGFQGASGSLSQLTAITGGYQLLRDDQTRLTFDSNGTLTGEVDRNGEGLGFAYASGLLATIIDTAGRTITVSSNIDGTISGLALPDGRSVAYGYSGGRLTSVTDLRGNAWTYRYDSNGQLDRTTDPLGHIVAALTYDGDTGRVLTKADGLNNTTSYGWDPATQTANVTDPRGGVTKDVYSDNVLVERIDALDHTTRYHYNSAFDTTSVVDPRGNTTTTTYDAAHNLLTQTNQDGSHESWTYNAFNEVLTHANGRGYTTSYTYDTAGNKLTETSPGAAVTTWAYDPAGTGLPISKTDPRGKSTTYEYDSQGNLVAVTSPLGEVTTMTYDSAGRKLSVVDPRGNASGANPDDYRTTLTYDAGDHKLSQTDPLGDRSTWVYDTVGNLSSTTDPNGHTTGYAYDDGNNLASVVAPGGAETAYTYDADGNLSTKTDPNAHVTTYGYDAANQATGVQTPLSRTWAYAYDANGNKTTITVPGGGVITKTYDSNNRITGISYSDGTHSVSYAYDDDGNRVSMTDGAGVQNYIYDNRDRLSSVSRGTASFTYSYDAANNVIQRVYPDGTTTNYAYDDDGRLSTVTNAGATSTYSYDAASNRISLALPSGNGYTESRIYDRAGRVTEVMNANATSTLSKFDYSYDPAGHATQITTLSGVENYVYDNRDRLSSVCYLATACTSTDPHIAYTYDAVGNRLSQETATGTTTYAYDAGDQLTSATDASGTTSYGYDLRGNQTSAGARTFTFDLTDKMTSTNAGSATTSYSYDGDGDRLQAASPADTTNYIWDVHNDMPQLATESGSSGNPVRSYIYGVEAISVNTAGTTNYLHRDRLGSVVDVTSATGATEWSYSYEPFGNARTTTKVDSAAAANPIGYVSQLQDAETGLYDLRARMYDPTIGRFLSTDPLAAEKTDPGTELYDYALQDPINGYDLDGKRPVVDDPKDFAIWYPNAGHSRRDLSGALVIGGGSNGSERTTANGSIVKQAFHLVICAVRAPGWCATPTVRHLAIAVAGGYEQHDSPWDLAKCMLVGEVGGSTPGAAWFNQFFYCLGQGSPHRP